MHARDGPREPYARPQLGRTIVLHETAAGGLVIGLHRRHRPRKRSRVDPLEKNAAADMGCRQRAGMPRGSGATERDEPAGVIAVVVGQDDDFDVRQVDLQLLRIQRQRLGPGAGVDEQPASIRFDQCRKPPLAHTSVGEHRRQNGDLQRMNARRRRPLGGQSRHDRDDRNDSHGHSTQRAVSHALAAGEALPRTALAGRF